MLELDSSRRVAGAMLSRERGGQDEASRVVALRAIGPAHPGSITPPFAGHSVGLRWSVRRRLALICVVSLALWSLIIAIALAL